jgi:hypothetical protein
LSTNKYDKEVITMAGSPKCKSAEHKMHICAIKERRLDKKKPDKFREITANSQHKCGVYGARAKNSENLCKPVKL